jgi:hypothetical protein
MSTPGVLDMSMAVLCFPWSRRSVARRYADVRAPERALRHRLTSQHWPARLAHIGAIVVPIVASVAARLWRLGLDGHSRLGDRRSHRPQH